MRGDTSAIYAAIQGWLEEEHVQLPEEEVTLREQNGRYFIELEEEFDPGRFVEVLEEDSSLNPDWVNREEGVIGATKEQELSSGIVDRGAYGTTFHREDEITLSTSGPPVLETGEPVDDSMKETLELLSLYFRHG